MSGIAITGPARTAEELRAASSTAARSCGMDRQALRDWVHRYEAEVWRAWPIARHRDGPPN